MIDLSQQEADALLSMEKIPADHDQADYPSPGEKTSIPLISRNRHEEFLLDIWHSRQISLKGRYQNRARSALILARLDFGGAPHRNPDNKEIKCLHLHVYKEGYGDKWAIALPSKQFSNPSDPKQTLNDFMRYCNIEKLTFQETLLT